MTELGVASYPHAPLSQITASKELNFEAQDTFERDWLVSGFQAVIEGRGL